MKFLRSDTLLDRGKASWQFLKMVFSEGFGCSPDEWGLYESEIEVTEEEESVEGS